MTLLEKAHRKFIQENLSAGGIVNLDDFLEWYATNVHNAALESALEALPEKGEVPSTVEEAMFNTFKNGISRYSELARTKLSALKKENV